MVEFALILFPLLILVAGIIQFGIALNYWLDMQRIANQGARWAAVNNWPPDCPAGSAVGDCDGSPNPTLQQSLVNAAVTTGLRQSVTVDDLLSGRCRLPGPSCASRLELAVQFAAHPRLAVARPARRRNDAAGAAADAHHPETERAHDRAHARSVARSLSSSPSCYQ